MMKTKRILPLALTGLLLFSCSGNGLSYEKHSFTFAYKTTADFNETMYYTDHYFDDAATEYDASLATASLCMAMSAFASVDPSHKDLTEKSANNQKLMTSLGFSDFEANSYFQEKPGTDSMGATYCRKALSSGDTLIAIGLRGQGYEQEWAGNFELGVESDCDGKHVGFNKAATIVLDGLKNYITEWEITGDIKIWVAGYSRAGATANLVAGTLDEMLQVNLTLSDKVTYTKEDIYAYCFEAPMGAYLNAELNPHGEAFSNIFNIINRADPVPYVAMKELGFTRYGNDKFVSEPLSDPTFTQDIQKVKEVYGKMSTKSAHGEYLLDNFQWLGLGNGEKKLSFSENQNYVHFTQGQFLSRLLSFLTVTGVQTRENYVENLQSGIFSLFKAVYEKGAPKASLIDVGVQCLWKILEGDEAEVLIDDLLHQISYFPQDLLPIISYGLEELDIHLSFDVLQNGLLTLFKELAITFLSDLNLFFTCLSLDNLKAIGFAHNPDLCLAHMQSRDPNYLSSPITSDMSGDYYYFTVPYDDTKGTLEVLENGNVVASFEDKKPVKENSSIAYGIQDMQWEIYLPKTGSYEIVYEQENASLSLHHSVDDLVEPLEINATKTDGFYHLKLNQE